MIRKLHWWYTLSFSCCLYIYVRLSEHVLTAEDTGSFLSTTFGSCLVQAKRNFDRFMNSQLQSIQECRVTKKKCGIIPFITNFEVRQCYFLKVSYYYFSNIDKWTCQTNFVFIVMYESFNCLNFYLQMISFNILATDIENTFFEMCNMSHMKHSLLNDLNKMHTALCY